MGDRNVGECEVDENFISGLIKNMHKGRKLQPIWRAILGVCSLIPPGTNFAGQVMLKRGLKGTYVAVEPFNRDRYIDEQAFRYNNRRTKDNPLNDSDRFMLALSQVANKRLTYKELTGKNNTTTPF